MDFDKTPEDFWEQQKEFLFFPDDLPSPKSFWDPFLTRQHRVLLHTEPLLRFKRRDAGRENTEGYSHYDSLTIALKALNFVIEQTGFEPGPNRATVLKELLPLLEAMDRAANVEPKCERQKNMGEAVLAGLLNDEKKGRPYEIPYTDFRDGEVEVAYLPVRLLEEQLDPGGGPSILVATNEGVNLCLQGLTLDIENAQAATEAIIKTQLTHGRFYEAAKASKLAHIQSNRLCLKLEHILLTTRRNIRAVDWKTDAPHLIQFALEHLENRCKTETDIASTARAQREHVEAGSKEAAQLTTILMLMGECQHSHIKLQQRLLEARQTFLDEQARQFFQRRETLSLPSLEADVLTPLLKASCSTVEQFFNTKISATLGPHAPKIFSLTNMLSRQFQPRPPSQQETRPVAARTFLPPVLVERNRYTAETYQQANAFLAKQHGSKTLSEFLQEGEAQALAPETLELLVFWVLRSFDPSDKHISLFTVSRLSPPSFTLGGFSGDDVLLQF